jgi:hypothetical protein
MMQQQPRQPGWAPAQPEGTFIDLRDYGCVVARPWRLIAARRNTTNEQQIVDALPVSNSLRRTSPALRSRSPR